MSISEYSKELRTLENDELTNRLISQAKEQELHDADSHSESFVEYLNSRHLFDSLFEIDVEGRAMLDMDDGSDSEEVNEFYIEYEDAFINICKEIFFIGQQQFVNRQEEINQFTKCVDDAKRDNQKESIVSGYLNLGCCHCCNVQMFCFYPFTLYRNKWRYF